MTHFGGFIIALKEEVKNTLCPRTPVYLQDKQPSIFAMKAVVYITELSTYFPEGSTFHLRICWIVIVITQYLRHFHRSYDNYLISFSFISPSSSTSFLVFLFFPFFSFFIQTIKYEWCGYPSCWLETIVRFLPHGKFWVWRWRMDASHEG